MQARSAAFDAAMSSTHQRVVQVQALYNGTPVDLDTRDGLVPISDGQVRCDRNGFIRRTLEVQVADQRLRQVITPFGWELRTWMGCRLPSGALEVLCLGTFGVRDDTRAFPSATYKLTGMDRGKRVAEFGFLLDRPMPAGSAVQRMQTLIAEASPLSSFIVDPRIVDVQIPGLTYRGARDTAVGDLAKALGGEVYATTLGDFLLRPIPDMYGPADFDLQGALLSDQVTRSREGVFNATVAFGQSTGGGDTPSSLLVTDDDVNSPTYYNGPYGKVTDPNPLTLPSITSNAQADLVARARLRDRVGLSQAVSWTSLCNPAYEPSDVGRLAHPDGTVSQHVVDSLTFPLTVGPMSGDSRAVVVA